MTLLNNLLNSSQTPTDQLRQDVENLLNTRLLLEPSIELKPSVLTYGLPDYRHTTTNDLINFIRETILVFEPRLKNPIVHALNYNTIQIEGQVKNETPISFTINLTIDTKSNSL